MRISLKKLLLETSDDYPEDSDKWDSWDEYIEHFEYDLEKNELKKLIKRFDLKYKIYLNNKIVKISDQKNQMWFEYDANKETFDRISDINQWIYDNSDSVDVDIIWNGHIDCTLKDMERNPGKVYHYTTEEGWESIQQDGKMIGSSGTGITNRGAHGIFTSVDPEEHAVGTYGNICLELDLERFKTETNLPKLNLQYEPDVAEYLCREYIAHCLEIENWHDSVSSDMSPYTIIVMHTIPINFIKPI